MSGYYYTEGYSWYPQPRNEYGKLITMSEIELSSFKQGWNVAKCEADEKLENL